MPRVSSSGGTIRTLGRAAFVTIAGFSLCAPLLGAEITGYVKREIYYKPGTGEPNGNPATFANPNYPNTPDAVTYLTSFAAPQSADPNVEDYLTKLSGFIHPAVTGDYIFFFSSDDHGALYVSTDDSPTNLKLIAQETNWSNPLQWQTSGGTSDLAAKKSASVHLEKGKKYYAVALGKEGGGGDNTGVTMIPAGDVTADFPADGDASTLTGDLISTEASTVAAITKQPLSQTIFQGRPVTFSTGAYAPPGDPVQDETKVVPGVTYQWQRNKVDIALVDNDGDGIADDGSNTATYTIDPVALADSGAKFRCVMTVGSKTLTSDEATLTVSTDNVPPTVSGVGGDGNPADALTTITLTFSEKMDTATLNAATYKVSGGVTVSSFNVGSPTLVVLTTSKQTENTPYTVTVTGAKDIAGNALTPNTADISSLAFKTGLVNYARWENNTQNVDDFIAGAYLTDVPTYTEVLSQFYYPATSPNVENFSSHIGGYFLPPSTGDYVFFYSSDDNGVLYLSTDDSPANRKAIARETSWSNAGDWTSSGNGGADLTAKRSDTYDGTEWPTGATISLTKGKKYYIESFQHEGGGGDNNTATFKLASDADPANGSTALKGDVIGTYADLSKLAPVITTRPTGIRHYNKGDTLTFTVVVDSPKPVTYQWYRSKKAIAGATSATLTIANAGAEATGDYLVVATSVNGSASSYPDDDVRAIMNGAFVIEMEDFNYGGGKSVAAASTMPLAPSLYAGLDGLPGIDFHLQNQSTADATANGNVYRNGYNGPNGAVDFPILPEALGNVDVLDDAGNGDRGSFQVAQNHKIGWGDTGEWYQYTRDFPPGTYNVVLGAGLDGRGVDALGARLEIVTGDITKVGAATTPVASLLSDGTGAWSSDDYITFKSLSDSTKLAEVTLGANTTVRAVMSAGGYDFDFLLFYPLSTPPPVSISISPAGVITYTGTLIGSSDAAGPYTPVAGATGGTFTPDKSAAAQKFYRASN